MRFDDSQLDDVANNHFVPAALSAGLVGRYAEALGNPVIFTCGTDLLDDKTRDHHPHFDTSHQKIIECDSDNLAAAAE
jgi:hypothetical protein